MATNLTPAQLLALQQLLSGRSAGNAGTYMDGATAYQPYEMFGQPQGEGGMGASQAFGGAIGYDPNATKPGDKFSNYGSDGAFSNEGEFKDMSGLDPLLLAFLAAAGGMAAFLPGGFAAGGAGSSAAGAANGMWDVLPAAAEGTAGATGTAGAGLGASYGATGPSTFMQGAGITGAGGTGAGALTGGSALTNVLGAGSGLGALGGLLGPAATILGGLAGAQGQDNTQSQTKQMPDWLKQFYTDGQGGGLLPMGMGLLQSQMTPERMAQLDAVRSQGLGLLSGTAPVQRDFLWRGK